MEWTKAQKDAVEISRRDVLVAAAAGSGKTATLTERVLQAVCRDEDPVDISRLLIVTFTEKAAEELRIRIRKKLQEKAAAEPKNSRVRRQLSLLPSASISTIHSFYVKVLREGFSSLGLPPKLRIADEGSVEMIRRRVMNDVIDGYYNESKKDGFEIDGAEDFFDTFERIRPDGSLYDTLCDLYDTVASYPEFLDFYKNCAEKYEKYADDFGQSEHFKYFLSSAKKRFSDILRGFEQLEDDYATDEDYINKYRPTALFCIDLTDKTLGLLDAADYDKLYEYFSEKPDFPRNKPVKGEPGFKDAQNALKSALVKELGNASKILSFNSSDVKDICKKTSYLCGCIYKILSRFEKEFSAEKLNSGLVDFNDMERYAHRLICRGDGEFAKKIANRYDEIYVDEYQDVNGIQDEIFAAISKNDRFMVGDVKQSIYSFRGADPSLFSSYRQIFKPYDPSNIDPAVIFLSKNFRCGRPIIDFTNEVFRTVFGADGRIPYSKDDELVYGKTEGDDVPVKLTVFEGGKIADEAEYAAKEIKRLLKEGTKDDGKPLSFSDIAVLCQKGSACAAVEKVFSDHGLPCVNTSDKTFFNSPEVLLTVSILSAIDNPISDVQLAAAMKSPVFGFTLDELANIRLKYPDEPLYTALREYANETQDEKCLDFIKTLSYLRYRSRSMPTDKFIRLLYKETRLLSVVYNEYDKKEPSERRGNLILLYELSRKFESDSFKGLYGFISYCREMTEKGKSFSVGSDTAGKITVQTVHGSKGLEYPVCFIIGAGSKFNTDYNKKTIIADRRLGLGIRIKTDGDAVLTGPLYKTEVMKKADDQITDQACMLYVAMTRAKKYLYITASSTKEPVFTGGRYSASCSGCSSFLDFLRVSLDGNGGSYVYECISPEKEEKAAFERAETAALEYGFDGSEEFEKLKEIFNYEYPYKEAASLPKKAAVSKLYPEYLDTDYETVNVFDEDEPAPLILPDYAEKEKAATAAERGTSTHLFMQFCDLEKAEADVYAEAQRLVELGFIRQENKDLISYKEIEAFFRSDLYKRMKAAKNKGRLFCREYRFNIELDAPDFTADPERKKALSEEKLLVQGVIDCFFEEEDGSITVADYKTDRVYGEGAVTEFKARHAMQLSYYKKAVERIALLPVGKCELYSFCLGRSVVL